MIFVFWIEIKKKNELKIIPSKCDHINQRYLSKKKKKCIVVIKNSDDIQFKSAGHILIEMKYPNMI